MSHSTDHHPTNTGVLHELDAVVDGDRRALAEQHAFGAQLIPVETAGGDPRAQAVLDVSPREIAADAEALPFVNGLLRTALTAGTARQNVRAWRNRSRARVMTAMGSPLVAPLRRSAAAPWTTPCVGAASAPNGCEPAHAPRARAGVSVVHQCSVARRRQPRSGPPRRANACDDASPGHTVNSAQRRRSASRTSNVRPSPVPMSLENRRSGSRRSGSRVVAIRASAPGIARAGTVNRSSRVTGCSGIPPACTPAAVEACGDAAVPWEDDPAGGYVMATIIALFLIGLPLALGLLSHTIPGDKGLGPDPAGYSLEAQRLLVVLIVGAAFMGVAVAIREIVNEGSIYRRGRGGRAFDARFFPPDQGQHGHPPAVLVRHAPVAPVPPRRQ